MRVTSELRDIFSSAMSRLGVGIGFGPQKEDSMSIVCGEPDLSPEEEEEMEETLVSPMVMMMMVRMMMMMVMITL